jgi:hypothetical protein
MLVLYVLHRFQCPKDLEKGELGRDQSIFLEWAKVRG